MRHEHWVILTRPQTTADSDERKAALELIRTRKLGERRLHSQIERCLAVQMHQPQTDNVPDLVDSPDAQLLQLLVDRMLHTRQRGAHIHDRHAKLHARNQAAEPLASDGHSGPRCLRMLRSLRVRHDRAAGHLHLRHLVLGCGAG